MHTRLGFVLCGFLLALTLAAAPAIAQPLADRLPADTAIYIGWRGTDAAGPAFENSHLKGFIEAGNLREQADNILARIVADAKTPEDAANAKKLFAFVQTMVKYPTALYFGGLDQAELGKPMPKLALVCRAGPAAQGLVDQMTAAIKANPNPDPKAPAMAKVVGPFALLTIGTTPELEKLLAEAVPAQTLANDPNFKAALAQVQPDPVAIVYLHGEKLLEMVDDAVATGQDRGARKAWPIIVDALGLAGAGRFVATGGFDGKNWSTQAFFHMEPNRAGLLGQLDAKPLSDDSLKLIPQSATWAGALRFDAPRLLKDVREGLRQSDPSLPQQMDFIFQQAGNFLGFDLQKDLLNVLSDEWLYYGSPEATGQSIRGLTLLNKVKDEAGVLRALESLEDLINGQLAKNGGEKSFTTEKAGEMTIHTLKLPVASPSWTVHQGMLYIALAPQSLQAAAAYHADKTAKSILENPDFTALRKQLSAKEITSFSFADLPKTAPEVYELFNLALTAAAANAGEKKLPFELPPLFKIKPYLAPALSVQYVDEKGWHLKGTSPFPGSGVFTGEQTLAEIAAVALGERTKQARGQAKEVSTAVNLKQLGQGCHVYAATHLGQFPPDLGALVISGELGKDGVALESFVRAGGNVPAEIRKATPEKQAEWVNQNSSFVYRGGGKKATDMTPQAVLAHERFEGLPDGARLNVLFADGHVELLTVKDLKRHLADAQTKP